MTEPTPASSPAKPAARPRDLGLALGVLALTGFIFWPAARWVATQTFAHEQIKQSFVLMVLAGAWMAWDQRARLRPTWQLTNAAIAWLLASYALVGGAMFLETPLFVLAGLVAAVGGAVHFVFGAVAFRRTVPLLAAFALVILFVLLFPVLDWPLRKMAGIESARLLHAVGLAPKLAIAMQPEVKLYLLANGGRFVVETECNGFGLITSSLLLGTILLLYRRARWWKFPVLLPACVFVAFAFNALRIFAIVSLAPSFPGHYAALHEVAGLVALYSGLGVVWFLTGRRAPVTAGS